MLFDLVSHVATCSCVVYLYRRINNCVYYVKADTEFANDVRNLCRYNWLFWVLMTSTHAILGRSRVCLHREPVVTHNARIRCLKKHAPHFRIARSQKTVHQELSDKLQLNNRRNHQHVACLRHGIFFVSRCHHIFLRPCTEKIEIVLYTTHRE